MSKDIENGKTDEGVVVPVPIDKDSDDEVQCVAIPVEENTTSCLCKSVTQCGISFLVYFVVCIWLLIGLAVTDDPHTPRKDFPPRLSEECLAIVNCTATSVSEDLPHDLLSIEFEVGNQEPLDLEELKSVFQQQLLPKLLGCGKDSNPLPEVANALVVDIVEVGECHRDVDGNCKRLAMDLLVDLNGDRNHQRPRVMDDIGSILSKMDDSKDFVEELGLGGFFDFIEFDVQDL